MSRVVPTKLTSYKPMPVGVSNKNFQITYASLIPANSSGGAEFKPDGTNRILFRVPAYQNQFLDNSRSSLSFTFKVDQEDADATTAGNILNWRLGTGCIFKRLQIKSPNGLVIEDITDLHILNKILHTMKPVNEPLHQSGLIDGDSFMEYNLTNGNQETMLAEQRVGRRFQYFFETGMLSRHLQAYLPLHSMNGGNAGHAFSMELTLNDKFNVLKMIGAGTANTSKSYTLSEVKYNMTLLKADASIIERFNNLANDSSEIVIPFSTYRAYTNSLSTKTSSVQISEACSDLRRVHTVLLSTASPTVPVVDKIPSNLQFLGGIKNASQKVKSYQLQVGSHFIYNEPIECGTDNSDLLQQLINASFTDSPIKATRVQNSTPVPQYSDEYFSLTSTFCYNDPDQMTNGISLGSLPLVMKIELDSTPANKYLLTFSELGYNLVIKDGYLSVRDSKDIGDFGY